LTLAEEFGNMIEVSGIRMFSRGVRMLVVS
jgi:hypothetical protein